MNLFTKLIVTIGVTIVMSTSSIQAADWQWMNPDPQGNTIHKLWCAPGEDLFGVGEKGTIVHWNGVTLDVMDSNTQANLHEIWGTGSDNIYAGGNELLHYNGVLWSRIIWPDETIQGIWGIGSDNIYLLGTHLNGTTIYRGDGTNWTAVHNTDKCLYDIWGLNGDDIYAVGASGRAVHWDGVNWTEINYPQNEWLYTVYGFSSQEVYAAGLDGLILHWNGQTWQEMYEMEDALSFDDIWGEDPNDFYVAGDKSTNGKIEAVLLHWTGAVWEEIYTGTDLGLKSVRGTSSQNITVAGTGGVVNHYDGTEWTRMTQGPTEILNAVWADDSGTMIMVGKDGLILEWNGNVLTEMESGTEQDLNDVWGSAPDDVFAVGHNIILHWDGSVWSEVPREGYYFLHGIWGTGSNDVFVVGEMGLILHYDGTTWVEMPNSGDTFTDVWGTSSDNVYAVGYCSGENGVIYRWNGLEWSCEHYETFAQFSGIWGDDTGRFYAVGLKQYNGGIVRCTDGVRWFDLINGRDYGITNVWGSSSHDVHFCGGGGYWYHYDGSNWTSASTPASNTLLAVTGFSAEEIFLVGFYGTILSSSSVQPTPTPSSTPNPCTQTGVTLTMPSHHFQAGDECSLTAEICNAELAGFENIPFFCLMAFSGNYWFYPSWSQSVDFSIQESLPVGVSSLPIIEPFVWPDGVGSAQGIQFISAMTDPEISAIIGVMGIWEFGWE